MKLRCQHIVAQILARLSISLSLVFLGSSIIISILLTLSSLHQTKTGMKTIKEDIIRVYQKGANDYVQMLCTFITNDLESARLPHPQEHLLKLQKQYEVNTINVVNDKGVVIQSTDHNQLGYNFNSSPETQPFLELLSGNKINLIQQFRLDIIPVSFTENAKNTNLLKYAGEAFKDGSGFVEMGVDTKTFMNILANETEGMTANWHLPMGGTIIIADKDNKILSNLHDEFVGMNLADIGIDTQRIRSDHQENQVMHMRMKGKRILCSPLQLPQGHMVLIVVPTSNVMKTRTVTAVCLLLVVLLTLFVQGGSLLCMLRKTVIGKIKKVNESLRRIAQGNLDEKVNVGGSCEFAELSKDINITVDALRHYIAETTAQMGKELVYARNIQRSILPSVFPPFPNHREFDVFAYMQAAKEVGGDFYDFFFITRNRIAFLVADVSGKGFPAALKMMHTKTLLKSYAQTNQDITEIFTHTNQDLCVGNRDMVFITAWMGIMDLITGKLEVVNAGHTRPVFFRQSTGQWEIQNCTSNLVLGVMKDFRFKKDEYILSPGDKIFLYTDGITEAMNDSGKLFGEEKMVDALKQTTQDQDETPPSPQTICTQVMESVMDFSTGVPQADDITMLAWTVNELPDQKISEELRNKKWALKTTSTKNQKK